MSRDIRLQVRMGDATYNELQRLSERLSRSMSTVAHVFIQSGLGVREGCAAVVKSGPSFTWISDTGLCGEVTGPVLRRLLSSGGLPIKGEPWLGLYEDMESACQALGEPVFEVLNGRIIVRNLELFDYMRVKIK